MSYILEALRKADAERERGAVPDIHTQPLFAADLDEAPARPRWVVPVLGASVVLLVAALAFVLLRRDEAPEAQAQGSAGRVVAAPGSPSGPVAAAPTLPPPASPAAARTMPPPSAPASPTPRPAAPSPSPATQAGPQPPGSPPVATSPAPAASPDSNRSATVAPTSAPSRDAPAGRTPPAASGGTAAAAPARKAAPESPARTERRDAMAATGPGAPTANERVYAPNELPEDVRRGLPAFTFGGAVYSDNAASRMLIINGQLFNEGGQPSPGVVLDQIRLKSAVFSYRGYRYEMPY